MAITERYVSPSGAGAKDGTSEANAYGLAEFKTAVEAGMTAGYRYNVIKGSYTLTGFISTTGNGTVVSPIVIRGYKTTIGDLDNLPLKTDGTPDTTDFPVFTCGAYYFGTVSSAYVCLRNLSFTGTHGSYTVALGTNSTCDNCVFANTDAGFGIQLGGATGMLVDSKVTGNTDAALNVYCSIAVVHNCTITSTSSSGIRGGTAGHVFVLNSVVANCGTYGIDMLSDASNLHVVGSTIYGNTSGGIRSSNNAAGLTNLIDSSITDNGTSALVNGYVGTADKPMAMKRCRTRDNTALDAGGGFTDWLTAMNVGEVTTDTGGASTDYTNAGSGDFTPVASSALVGAATFANRDIGGRQSASSGGGGEVYG